MKIVKDGTVSIDTIYRFADSPDDDMLTTKVFNFLWEARQANCTVHFRNEFLVIPPREDVAISTKVALYCTALMIAREVRRGTEMVGLQ